MQINVFAPNLMFFSSRAIPTQNMYEDVNNLHGNNIYEHVQDDLTEENIYEHVPESSTTLPDP